LLAQNDTNLFGGIQYYRDAIPKLHQAVQAFQARRLALGFVLSLGDIIDGFTEEQSEARRLLDSTLDASVAEDVAHLLPSQRDSLTDLRAVMTVIDGLAPIPLRHVVGNHCLYASREKLQEHLGLAEPYYSMKVRAAGLPGRAADDRSGRAAGGRWPPAVALVQVQARPAQAPKSILSGRPLHACRWRRAGCCWCWTRLTCARTLATWRWAVLADAGSVAGPVGIE
jgi:hypothetical protein